MKSFVRFILTGLLTSVLVFIILSMASKIFTPKWIDHDGNMMSYIIKGFYEEPKDSLDIIFAGNSDVYRGVDPLKLYKDYGITSYLHVSAGQRMHVAYYMLADAFNYQKPKVVVFNVDEIFFTHEASEGNYSKVFDNMRFSTTKIKAIFDENYPKTTLGRVSHLMPIFSYHSRYTELSKDDFKYAFIDYYYPLKGMDLVTIAKGYTGSDYMKNTTDQIDIPEENLSYMNKIKELCDKNNAKLILIELPSADSWNYGKSMAISAYAKENNLEFIDLNLVLDQMNFDWSLDTSDGGDHLNLYGAGKVTEYLGSYLKDNYEFEDKRLNDSYSYWEEDYQYYLNEIEKEKNS